MSEDTVFLVLFGSLAVLGMVCGARKFFLAWRLWRRQSQEDECMPVCTPQQEDQR